MNWEEWLRKMIEGEMYVSLVEGDEPILGMTSYDDRVMLLVGASGSVRIRVIRKEDLLLYIVEKVRVKVDDGTDEVKTYSFEEWGDKQLSRERIRM